jgi:hypothetical protein
MAKDDARKKGEEIRKIEKDYEALQKQLDAIGRDLQRAQDHAAKITSIKSKHVDPTLGAKHQAAVKKTDEILDKMGKLQDTLNKLKKWH